MTLLLTATPVGERLLTIAELDPERLFLITADGQRITYGQAAQTSVRLAMGLHESGIGTGDRFVVQLPNWPAFVYFHLALSLIGAVTVNLPIAYREREVSEVIKLTQAKGLALPRKYGKDDFLPIAGNLRNECNHLTHMFLVGPGDADDPAGVISFEAFIAKPWEERAGRDAFDKLAPGPDDLTVISFTSGTSGVLKGVMLTTRVFYEWNRGLAERYRFDKDECILAGSPLGHAVGFGHCLRMTLSLGCRMVLMDRWQADVAVDLVAQEGCTFIAGATPFLMDMVYHPDTARHNGLPSLRTFICGGATVPERLIADAQEKLPHTFITPLWGMTECGGVTSCPYDADSEKFTSTDGKPCDGMELKVVDSEGAELPHGHEGELLVRGPMNATGYFQQPELTAELFLKDGFFHTGDLARMDEDGYVKITGRLKDIVIRGGINVSPVEIENILFSHPKVANVAIVGMPDPRLGERICAFVVLNEGYADLPLDEVQSCMSDARVAKPKWPEHVVILDSLPMTPSGKVQKFKLREMLGREVSG